MSFVQIAVNVPQVSGVFDYGLPPHLEGKVVPGCLVTVPFGRQTVQGITVRFIDEPSVPLVREVLALLDPLPVITPSQMALAQELAQQTLAPLAACLDLMLPPGLSQQADWLYSLVPHPPEGGLAPTPFQERLLSLLRERGGLRGRQLDAAFPHVEWKAAAQGLIKKGWIISQPVLPLPVVRPKMVRTVQIACSPEKTRENYDQLGTKEIGERRIKILEFLIQESVPVELPWVYSVSGGNIRDLERLAEKGLVILSEEEAWRDPLENVAWEPHEIPLLTEDQQSCFSTILEGLRGGKYQPYLLHGVTGSGKTEIYLQAAAETLRQGRQVIILVPEISLTPQTVRRFMGRFPGQVALVHSRLSPGERYDTWRRIRAGALPLVVGPRSALFAPVPDPGLIVVDECHDGSYYQGDTPPCYNAVKAALMYARLSKSAAILGSATPDIGLYYQAQRPPWRLLSLPARVLAHREAAQAQVKQFPSQPPIPEKEGVTVLELPPVKVVDMRQELKAGSRSIFSRPLLTALETVLERQQQAILFLNRRGSATYVFCRACGYILRCPRCEMPLTYHIALNNQVDQKPALICHHCNYRRNMPSTCPQCGSNQIRQYGTGTEKVESEVLKFFPQARTLRWDAETTQKKGAHEIILSHFVNHRADVLVGTQMLAKGLDLPLVTVVGVILADVGLSLPDYRAAERTFQLLTQVAGRAGRSPLGGKVIFQTFMPENYAIQAASAHDFKGFYAAELEKRRQIGYPPFSRLARLEFRDPQPEKVQEMAQRTAFQVRQWMQEGGYSTTEMIGPTPCFFHRLKGVERWQIVLRGPDPASILRGRTLENCRIEIDPQSLL